MGVLIDTEGGVAEKDYKFFPKDLTYKSNASQCKAEYEDSFKY